MLGFWVKDSQGLLTETTGVAWYCLSKTESIDQDAGFIPRSRVSTSPCARLFPKALYAPLNQGISGESALYLFTAGIYRFLLSFFFFKPLIARMKAWALRTESGSSVVSAMLRRIWNFAVDWWECCSSARLMGKNEFLGVQARQFAFSVSYQETLKQAPKQRKWFQAVLWGDILHLIRKWRFMPPRITLWPENTCFKQLSGE